MLRDCILFYVEFSDLIRAIILLDLFEGLLPLEELFEFHVCLSEHHHPLTLVLSDSLTCKSASLMQAL